MKKQNSILPSIFLHITKTAGTSLVTEMRWHYGNDNCVSHYDHAVGLDHYTMQHELFQHEEKVLAYAAHPFISGHFGFSFCERFMSGRYAFTFLRDPAERIVSFYYFCKSRNDQHFPLYRTSQDVSLDTFLDMACEDKSWLGFWLWNHQVWSLAYGNFACPYKSIHDFGDEELLRLAKHNADRLDYIGFVETFEKDKAVILNSLGIENGRVHEPLNCTKQRPQLKELLPSTRKRLAKLTELDNELYQYLYTKSKAKQKRLVPRLPQAPSIKECINTVNIIKDYFPRYSQQTVDSLHSLVQKKRQSYLDLMEKILCGMIYKDPGQMSNRRSAYNEKTREYGWDWPLCAHSMVGLKRLNNVRLLMESVLGNAIPGDVIETGVWRGGASIMMRAVLQAYDVTNRKVYLADSFEGLPPPSPEKYPADAGADFHTYPELSVSLEAVQENFAAYGLLDEQVKFIKGWFKDTLPTIETTFALIRLDGDMYESTMDALVNLYDKLSDGGYVIVDDYHVVPACKLAIHDFYAARKIKPKLEEIDGVGIYWKKTALDVEK